jgi:hypothetical protein
LQLLLGASAACNIDGSVLLVAAGGLAAAAQLDPLDGYDAVAQQGSCSTWKPAGQHPLSTWEKLSGEVEQQQYLQGRLQPYMS